MFHNVHIGKGFKNLDPAVRIGYERSRTMTEMTWTDMGKLADAMENAIKMQNRANAVRRSEKAKQEQEEFEEKLMRAAASRTELEGLSSRIKGTQAAVMRDQLVNLISSF